MFLPSFLLPYCHLQPSCICDHPEVPFCRAHRHVACSCAHDRCLLLTLGQSLSHPLAVQSYPRFPVTLLDRYVGVQLHSNFLPVSMFITQCSWLHVRDPSTRRFLSESCPRVSRACHPRCTPSCCRSPTGLPPSSSCAAHLISPFYYRPSWQRSDSCFAFGDHSIPPCSPCRPFRTTLCMLSRTLLGDVAFHIGSTPLLLISGLTTTFLCFQCESLSLQLWNLDKILRELRLHNRVLENLKKLFAISQQRKVGVAPPNCSCERLCHTGNVHYSVNDLELGHLDCSLPSLRRLELVAVWAPERQRPYR